MTLADRLKKALDEGGHLAADLARACRVKPPSVSAWLSGDTKEIKAVPLLDAAEFLRVSPRWLAEGIGPMRPVGHHAAEPPARYESWPFSSVSRSEFYQLPRSVQLKIDEQAGLFFRDWHAHQGAERKRAT